MKRLVLIPGCGLCNRIQSVVCGQLLAEDTGREYFVHWDPTRDCAAALEDLFGPVFPRLESIPESAACYSSIQRYESAAPERYRARLARDVEERFSGLRSDERDDILILTCHQFLGYFHDPRFAPRLRELFRHVLPEISGEAEAFRNGRFSKQTVGVHVRRKDWRSQLDLDSYIASMRRFPDATFFVCSDEPETLDEVRRHVPTAIGFPKSSLDRDDPVAIREALIDVILLSSTSYLIGTPGSTFSAVAQTVGGIPGTFDYGFSISRRDLKLGNLSNPGRTLLRRIRRRRA